MLVYFIVPSFKRDFPFELLTMCAYAGASYAQVLNHFSTKFSLKSMTFILRLAKHHVGHDTKRYFFKNLGWRQHKIVNLQK